MDRTTSQPISPEPTMDCGEQLGSLLSELSATQADLLALLARKRELVVNKDSAALNQLHADEQRLVARLSACCQQRQQLLETASEQGLPAQDLRSLASTLPREQRGSLRSDLDQTRRQARLLQHQSLANWVLVQRSLLHLSQMMEIIATGGRMRPTYGKQPNALSGGALMDQAV